MNFNELNISNEIMTAIEEMGFEKATPIQSKTIPLLLEGKDIIGQSQTGTGKTAAFAIPILEKVDPKLRKPQVLILCPTRELAVQVCAEIRRISKYMHGIKAFPVYGGEPIHHQITGLRKGVQIIVGTPGRIMDHMKRRTLRFDELNTLILDEADEMLKMGFREDIEEILEHVQDDRQTILFSATMPKSILEIVDKYQNQPKLIKVVNKELTTKNVAQHYYQIKDSYKTDALCRLLDTYQPKLSLVFCNTKSKVDQVTKELLALGYSADKIHGDIDQRFRLEVLDKFNHGIINVLIATDVAARGLDIRNVEAVFNYDVPEKEDYYVHRIGRTGRAGRSGSSHTLVSRRELQRLFNINHYIGTQIPKGAVPSLRQVNDVKAKSYTDELKHIIDTHELSTYHGLVDEMELSGYNYRDIAAALLSQNVQFDEGKDHDLSYRVNSRESRRTKDDQRKGRGRDRGGRQGNKRDDKNSVRLFINVGKKDRIKVGDLVGAIAGESNIPGRLVGDIDIYDKYSFVNVPKDVSQVVIDSMNQARIRGRKVNIEIANKK
ncbi:DEAD/DEAH box helicase [Vallitalea okinawensis]|uniref:DEAD/DEAH box helicase n=1 Tax=Vallitalea okinawensis TaxID=2078660 RepID=UPI000CFB8C8B|nr:DEAD/DEAH box helicase [Vallitalea okinawensis]